MSSKEEFKFRFGWNDFFENQTALFSQKKSLVAGRVINEERQLYRIATEEGVVTAQVSGRISFHAEKRIAFPAIGDWVMLEINPHQERAVIKQILERKNKLSRKQSGVSADIQLLAANVDIVFIATSLNDNLNINRLYRYMTFVKESKARPVILLTKSDLLATSADVKEKVMRQFPDVDVQMVNQKSFDEAVFLQEYLKTGTTSVIVGSSGVGKSTLINYLIGEQAIKTAETRESDDKGRHTTTARSMYETRFGGLIIDSPGMRELQFFDHSEGFKNQFADIEELVSLCRYSNCSHVSEPGCAVIKALESDELSFERWRSYQKIKGEIAHTLRKENKWMLAEIRKTWKKRSIESRKFKGWT